MRKAIIKSNGHSRSIDLDVRLADTVSAADTFEAYRTAIQARRETVLRELATLNEALGYSDTDCRTIAAS